MTNDTTSPPYHLPPPDRSRERLAALLDLARGQQPSAAGALHGAVRAYVRELKRAGVPPEKVIVAVKALANRSGVPNSRHDDVGGVDGTDRVMRTLVQWSIAEYYRPD